MKKSITSQQEKESAFPVLKFDFNYNVIYSNTPAKTILENWNSEMKESLRSSVMDHYSGVYHSLKKSR